MTSLIGKTGLYDLLSMVLPGYLMLFLISKAFCVDYNWEYDEITCAVSVFCVSYVLGIIVHYLSRIVFRCLGNRCLKEYALRIFTKDIEVRHSSEYDPEDKLTTAWYYNNYYRLWKRNSLSFIQALEIQLTFLRSLVVVGTAFSLAGWLFIHNACCISLLVAFTIICLILLIHIQVKIYYYYCELDFYIKDNQSNEGENE